jgi:hypothetical protein
MKRCFCYGFLLAISLILSASCSSILNKLRNQPLATPQPKKRQVLVIIIHPEKLLPELTFGFQPNPFIQFIEENQRALLAITALLCLWLLERAHQIHRGHKHHKLSIEDLALLKIIKDNATHM